MTYKAVVKDGSIVLLDAVSLVDGMEIRVEIPDSEAAEDEGPTLAERLAPLIGMAEGMPSDWSINHDKYLREEYER